MERMRIDFSTLQTALPSNQSISASSVLVIMQAASNIGKFSFSDYAGSFELKELNSLETIRIGTINETSNNFYYAPFNLHGIQLAINDLIQRSSKTHLLLPRRWILRWFSHLYPLELEFLTVDRDRKRMLYENKEIHNRRIERFAIALYRRVLLYKI